MGFDAFEIDSLKMCIRYIFGLYHILSGVYWGYIYVGRIEMVSVFLENFDLSISTTYFGDSIT